MSRKSNFHITYVLISVFLLSILAVQKSHAQTIYKQESGLFTGLPSFSAQGGTGNFELLIGPWIGYRLDENRDIVLHTEYFSDDTSDFSLMNIGMEAGFTFHAPSIMWRNKLRLYRVFNLSTSEAVSPKAFTVSGFTTGYYPVDVSNTITLLPYAGLFAFAGNKDMPPTRTNYLSGHQDGFVFGPRFGFDVNITFSSSFTWTFGAGYAVALTEQEHSNQIYNGLILTLQFNF